MGDYAAYEDKNVKIQLADETFVEGYVEAAAEIGVVIRPKGMRKTRLVLEENISAIDIIVAEPKKLKAKVMSIPAEGRVRDHLLLNHGYQLSEISKMSEEEAKAFHDTLDHADLGHRHRPKTEAELAIEQAAADAAEEGDEA